MSKIREAFENKKAFIGFLTAGDPSLEKTEEFIIEMEKAGAALVEIGIPFSDPIAEEKVVQDANVRALSAEGGCTTDMVFDMVERVRKKVSIPLVFLTYLNPVFKYGYEAFCKKCQEIGVDGIMVPDMPYEEKRELSDVAKKYDVDFISMITPASGDRADMIAKEADGYIYFAASKGMAENKYVPTEVEEMIQHIKTVTDTPVMVALGSGSEKKVVRYSEITDGVSVNNAVVKIIEEHGENAGKPIFEYVKSLTESMQ